MFVRLWAGPSCIARAISRRRSSWALRTIRDTAGGDLRVAGAPIAPAAASGSVATPAAGLGRRRGDRRA